MYVSDTGISLAIFIIVLKKINFPSRLRKKNNHLSILPHFFVDVELKNWRLGSFKLN